MEVSNNSPLIDKLLLITDRCQSGPAGYSLSTSQAASNALFHCTYNVKSAQPLMDCGVLGTMLNITKKLLTEENSDTPLRCRKDPLRARVLYLHCLLAKFHHHKTSLSHKLVYMCTSCINQKNHFQYSTLFVFV